MDVQALVQQALAAGAGVMERALGDLTEDEAAQRPHGLAPIVWQLGHLVVSEARLIQNVSGVDMALPAGYAELFAFGSSGEGPFPPLAEVRDAFARSQQELLKIAEGDVTRAVDGDRFYSNVAGALLFADRHRWYHIGKIMTLRSLLGKPRLLG